VVRLGSNEVVLLGTSGGQSATRFMVSGMGGCISRQTGELGRTKMYLQKFWCEFDRPVCAES